MSRDLCCICLDAYDPANSATTTTFPCGHKMHMVCLRQYIRMTDCTTIALCPLCRQPLMEDRQYEPQTRVFIPIVLNTIQRRPEQQEGAVDHSYKRGLYYTAGLLILLLFGSFLVMLISYYSKG